MDLERGKSYWLTFRDGSRIKVEAWIDSRGDVDAKNDDLDFFRWMGREGEPQNRDDITTIEEVI